MMSKAMVQTRDFHRLVSADRLRWTPIRFDPLVRRLQNQVCLRLQRRGDRNVPHPMLQVVSKLLQRAKRTCQPRFHFSRISAYDGVRGSNSDSRFVHGFSVSVVRKLVNRDSRLPAICQRHTAEKGTVPWGVISYS